ncbi:hypothetical protein RO3G_09236 [Rhizopus delemar RA 99-880]|uniref:Uncharacterized protein n=1 Tax=Rhizopus delemar (strain RA 99-880 / ATCC MYA-4621 / FGSC 9543 / NRRL 43880) TaxID=246409 RepID=I1C7U6_RHIO9|nr:hypothetical protein RO3G_09236 [Rhizopus delemar RA 99-880]|eukprot:EIE84526.1 hypothetical protein RO3G_09236 [Rhizopus delemar RA 99-880]
MLTQILETPKKQIHSGKQMKQVSVEGSQQRKYLSDSHVLSLSYIFLFSSANNYVLSKLPPDEQKLIMKSLNAKEHLKLVNNEVMNACQQTNSILNDEEMTMDKAEEAIDEIKSAGQNKGVKIASKIVSNLSFKILNTVLTTNSKERLLSLLRMYVLF